jgi:hypothetical protein
MALVMLAWQRSPPDSARSGREVCRRGRPGACYCSASRSFEHGGLPVRHPPQAFITSDAPPVRECFTSESQALHSAHQHTHPWVLL